MKRILFYYPSNKRSNQIETTLKELKSLGHEILLLTTCEKGDLHKELEKEGIKTYSHPVKSSSFFYYFSQIFHLIRFSSKNKIDLIFSNLQHANFIAIWAQFFISSRLITFRHHFKFSGKDLGIELQVNSTERLFDRWINRLASEIVVPSNSIKENILRTEEVAEKKLKVIPYLYNFSYFEIPKEDEVLSIKEKYKAELRLTMVSRLIPFKRHALVFPVFKKLIDEGMDIKVLVLDDGPEKESLQNFIDEHQLNDHIFLLSYQTQPLLYLKSSDLLVHPSITEASSNVAKECGLLSVPIAVCKEVGDFSEYVEDGKNAFVLDLADPATSLEELLRKVYSNKDILEKAGHELNHTIQANFGNNEKAIQLYKELIG